MRKCKNNCLSPRIAVVTLAIGLSWLGPGLAQVLPTEPVQELRLVLKSPVQDPVERDRGLKEALNKLSSISDLRNALLLHEWRDGDPDERVAAVDRAHRVVVAWRFEQAVHDVLQHGETTSRLALLNMLAEMGSSARAVGSNSGYARTFAPEVVALIRQEDPVISAAAARTLGQIIPDPGVVSPAFGGLFQAKEASLRLAAADGLSHLMQMVSEFATGSRHPSGIHVPRSELIRMGEAVVPLAGVGLSDSQPEVRRRSLEALEKGAGALSKMVLALPGADKQEGLGENHRQVEDEQAQLLPLILALRDQGGALTRALSDPDADVRLLARRTLEDMTAPLLRLVEHSTYVAPEAHATGAPRPSPFALTSTSRKDPLLQGLQDTVRVLAAGLSDGDVRARRAIIDVLETLGPAAVPAAPTLVAALADPDPFVRWAAARTLGKISPVAADTAVPGLARLLADPDLDLRLAAANALERYGPVAAAAIPALIQAIGASDAELRVAAIRTLGIIGGPAAYPAIPAISAAVADPDARVRKIAAEVLGEFGPAARQAVEPLRRALQDSNADVQKAAGETLLSIIHPVKK